MQRTIASPRRGVVLVRRKAGQIVSMIPRVICTGMTGSTYSVDLFYTSQEKESRASGYGIDQ